MSISQFTDVRNSRGLTFKDIWSIYDEQFRQLRNAYLELGDKYYVETFQGSINKNIETVNSFRRGELFVFKNGEALWEGDSYECVNSNNIRLLKERLKDDVIRVIILKTEIISENIERYVTEVREVSENVKNQLIEAERVINIIQELKIRYDDDREEYLEALRQAVNALIEYDTGRYDPDATLGEVKLARGIFNTLSDRLNMTDKRLSRMITYSGEDELLTINTKGPNPEGTVDINVDLIPFASETTAGIVKVGDGLKVSDSGIMELNVDEISEEIVDEIFSEGPLKDE